MSLPANIEALLERKEKLQALRTHFTPHPKQELVLDAIRKGCKKIFIRAARQSGKTQISAFVSWLFAGLNKGSVCSIITPTLKQAKKIYWKKGTIQRFGPSKWVAKEANDDLTLFFHNGSYIEIDGSDNMDAHRGDKKDLVILDEFKDIDERFYSEVIEPMFLTTEGTVVIVGTPPESPDSHFKQLEDFAQTDPSWTCIHWTSYDSPYTSTEWLDSKRRELAARGEDDVFRREYLAEYTTGGKNSVFPMFSKALHVKSRATIQSYYESIKDRCELYWINDPATSSTFGALLVAYYRDKGQLLYLNEVYAKDKEKTHTGAIVEDIKNKIVPFEPNIKEWQIVYDDAAIWFANELLHGHGLVATPAKKMSVEKEDGIGLFKSLLLQKNTVLISEACENLVKELENYIIVNGKYPKENDHLIDCVRYGLTFANVILSLSHNDDLQEELNEIYDYIATLAYDETGLPGYIQ